MKKLIIGLLICSVLYSCFHEVKVAEGKESCLLEANLRMRELIDSFVSINGKDNPVNEIYIDKISPHESDLILYTGNISLTDEENRFNNYYPVNAVIVSDVHFMIYSGVENYFTLPIERVPIVSTNKSSADIRNIWLVRDSGGIFKIEKSQDAYPFLPFPNKTEGIRFKSPSKK